VPTLVDGDHVIGQSLAIIEYLDETHPATPLLPATPAERARVRAIALSIACDTHPLNNLRVLKYLKHEVKADEEAKNAWYRHWVDTGLAAVESMLANSSETGRFCHGDTPTLADLCLVPQVFNARRFGCDLSARRRMVWWLSRVLLLAGSMLGVSMPISWTPRPASHSMVCGA
jgi:maleylpyruvate isomerase